MQSLQKAFGMLSSYRARASTTTTRQTKAYQVMHFLSPAIKHYHHLITCVYSRSTLFGSENFGIVSRRERGLVRNKRLNKPQLLAITYQRINLTSFARTIECDG